MKIAHKMSFLTRVIVMWESVDDNAVYRDLAGVWPRLDYWLRWLEGKQDASFPQPSSFAQGPTMCVIDRNSRRSIVGVVFFSPQVNLRIS